MKAINQLIRRVPGVSDFLKSIGYEGFRYCQGVYPSFTAAMDVIPRSRRGGYDTKEAASSLVHLLDMTKPSDYAIYFWLQPLLSDNLRIFDYGGNLGISYFSFQKHLRYPAGLRWMICDLPSVIVSGRELAVDREAHHLEFTTDFAESDGTDVLLTSGTLQFVEKELFELLRPLTCRPRHLLINRVPFSDRPTYYTIQDTDSVCCPYRISELRRFLDGLAGLGYELVDTWSCPESWCTVKFRPSLTVRSYTGLYLRLPDDSSHSTTPFSGAETRTETLSSS